MIHNPPLSPQPSVLSPQSSSFPALDALLLIVILNLVLQPLVEPDFGWHLRTGLDLLQQGWQLPVTDPYSHTMPEWPWVEHAWLTDGVLGLIYQGLGPAGALGVIIFFGAIAAGAFLIPSVTARTSRTYKLIAVALALWVTLPFLGARTQLITLLGIAVVLWLAKRARAGWITGLWAMPPLFLIWANVHGGFMAGLFVLGLLLAGSVAMRLVLTRWPSIAHRLHEPIMTWSEIRLLAIVTAVSALVTLANPYGWRLHAEIYDSLTNQFMIETLHEWQPVSLRNWAGRAYALYLAGLILVMLCCYRRVEPVRWTICLVFLGLSLRHWRNVLFFVLVSLPLCTELLKVLVDRVIASV
ncbi:MAG: hypothetical protein ACT4OO_06515, partial [Nitrospiraceae bacterium]